MSRTPEAKIADMTVGMNVTIPTEYSGTWTGEIVAIREPGPAADPDTIHITIRFAGQDTELLTDRRYTGYVNAPAPEATPLDTSRAARRAQDGAELLRMLVPTGITVIRDVNTVTVFAEGATAFDFAIQFDDGELIGVSTRNGEITMDPMTMLTVVRKHYEN